jgi:hypothetical protein
MFLLAIELPGFGLGSTTAVVSASASHCCAVLKEHCLAARFAWCGKYIKV